MKKTMAILIAAACLGFLGWRIYAKIKSGKEDGMGPRRGGGMAVAVEIAPVRKAEVREIERFTGSLRPRSQFVVAPKVAGRLEKLTVDVGDAVQSGQLIAQLDDDEYAQQVEQARAELAVAKATVAECKSALDVAARDLVRVRDLHDKKVASDSERDEGEARQTAAEAKHNVALAQVAKCEAALKAAEVRLSYTRIHVSWGDSGGARVVGERFTDEGAMLTANAPIVSVLDNSVMTAMIDVIERDYSKIRLGQTAALATDAYAGREFAGTVVRIAPMLKETSRQARIELEVSNKDGLLKPGMFVRSTIEFDRHENATMAPVSSLARRDGRQGVFAVDIEALKVKFVAIKTGITEGDMVEIVEPSLSGSVVTVGHHLLEDGSSIRLPESGGATGNRIPGKPGEGGGRR